MADADKDGLEITMGVRMTPELRALLDRAAKAAGFTATSEWLRVIARREANRVLAEAPEPVAR